MEIRQFSSCSPRFSKVRRVGLGCKACGHQGPRHSGFSVWKVAEGVGAREWRNLVGEEGGGLQGRPLPLGWPEVEDDRGGGAKPCKGPTSTEQLEGCLAQPGARQTEAGEGREHNDQGAGPGGSRTGRLDFEGSGRQNFRELYVELSRRRPGRIERGCRKTDWMSREDGLSISHSSALRCIAVWSSCRSTSPRPLSQHQALASGTQAPRAQRRRWPASGRDWVA